MRKTNLFIAALLAAAVVPASASAQRVREFEDSWFWGVKAGVSTFTPTFGESDAALTYGAEWMITRTHGALYLSLDEVNVSSRAAVFDPSADESFRPVQVENLHRVGVAALVFPKRFGRMRPYAGFGLSINVLGSARPMILETESAEDVDDVVFDRVDDHRSQAALLGMLGVQAQFKRAAFFVQASVEPGSPRFFLGDNTLGFFEAGIRYNFSGSREGIR